VRQVRTPAAAGFFYPREPGELGRAVRAYLDAATGPPAEARAIIAPHAGYAYSGPVAGSAYARLRGARGRARRVVLLGPAHFLAFEGLAASGAEAFATPLGEVPVDQAGVEAALSLPRVRLLEEAFEREHSIEVHLPFLQETLGEFGLVPLLVGEAEPHEVEAVIEALWESTTLVVVSSDLSHYRSQEGARKIDGLTSRAIEGFRPEAISPEQACGHIAVKGLMAAARRRGLRGQTLDLRTSGDTAGPSRRVVGYGAFLFA